MKDFSKLCTPAKVYFGIAAIATLFDLLNGVSIMLAFWKLVFAFIWTFILGGLCDKGYKSISWFLVLLPYILMFLASLNIYHVTDEQRQFMRSIQLQGAFGQEAFTEGQSSMYDPEKEEIERENEMRAEAGRAREESILANSLPPRYSDTPIRTTYQGSEPQDAQLNQDRLAALSLLSRLETTNLPNAKKAYEDAVRKKKPKFIKDSLQNDVKKIKKKISDIKIKYNM